MPLQKAPVSFVEESFSCKFTSLAFPTRLGLRGKFITITFRLIANEFFSAREAFGSDKNVSGSSSSTVNSRILDAGQGPPVDMDSQTQEDTQLAPLLHGAESQTQEDTQLVPVALALDRESQTQEDTQLTSELKRRAPSHGQSRANKKVKVSMAGEGVDIEE